ncbi:capsule assembly Wzi family protein [Pseudoalteromonas denitrificans]|uniref:Capsule assembly protein Wzi n=1 Tax=Pseudoalteromonas denitrificans DSM 6059 TaxID=1123010 RepID=A0A1I1DVS5_9GAMM|nr:capsule assembly Wzi family protein [Pseudoalteromonas denitrificans]SFB78512.1 Capsule assembly protein Wzi [Pseudoalteromonas denitrificans DSM 6059]
MKLKILSSLVLAMCALTVQAKPTAYLPIVMDAHLEQQIDHMFALTTGSPMSKPYALSEIDIALRQLKRIDNSLYDSVRIQLKRYRGSDDISRKGIKFTLNNDKSMGIANQRGLTSDEWGQGFFEGIWRPNDSTLLQVGLDYRIDSGELINYNTFFSIAGDSLQLDLGYKEHWFSPFKMSSQLISTNAESSPSISLGLSKPLSNWWNFDFELYYSQLEEVEQGIKFQEQWHDGRPRLAGTHISIEPFEGWKLGLNRLMHFGGGPRDVSFRDIMKAYFDPAGNDNSDNVNDGNDGELGDQLASVTSLFVFDWGLPSELYFEYGGEDTSGETSLGNGLNVFGNQVFASGLYFPVISNDWSLRYEYTSWHNAWYTNAIYKFGNTNNDNVYGHFAGDQRTFGDATPSDIHVMQVGYNEDIHSTWQLKLSRINNKDSDTDYTAATEVQLLNSRRWQKYRVETQLTFGKDVFDESYSYLSMAWFW